MEKSSAKKFTRRKQAFHSKYPASLEPARNLIMTGVSGDHEAVRADPRRRMGLGMAGVKIKHVLETMRSLLPKVEVPSYVTLRRWMSPPAANRSSSVKYFNLIPAKVAMKVFILF